MKMGMSPTASSALEESDRATSAVARAAGALRDLSLAAKDGQHLGSEAELQARLGVSRPTLRQAAKVVESERLITVRRGLNGGFFATRPDERDVVLAPALYLRLRAATLHDMHKASRAVMPEAIVAATACNDEALIAALRAVRDEIRDDAPPATIPRTELRLWRAVSAMGGNPVLSLFIDIAYAFGVLEKSVKIFGRDPEFDRQWHRLQRDLCDAILAKDAEIGVLLSRRRSDMIGSIIAPKDGALQRG